MFPPVDPTRRRFLAVAAVASAVSAGTLAAATAMDPSGPAAVTISRHSTTDPVFGAGGAVAALPIAAAAPAAAAQTIDAELIELGARFEPLVDQYYAVRAIWARALTRSHSEHDRKFGEPRDRDYQDTPEIRAAWEEACERNGLDDACARQSAIHKEMKPIADAINAASVTSIEGLRAKALVAFCEVAPLCAGDTAFSFDDAYPFQHLFTAVAELCGLKGKMATTGYALPDIGGDDSDDEGEEA
jgi:hypothetical protein